MTDLKKKHNKSPYQTWLVPGVIGLFFLMAIGFLVKVVLSPDGPRNKEKISTVTLLKPPPPEVKEKPPEPQVQKEAPQETIVTPVDSPQPQNSPDQSPDNTPAGSDLGVDSAGGAGGDAFGLVGKKGGRGITLGGGSGGGGLSRMSLLTKYGWYTRKVEKELWQQVKIILDKDGGIPKGKHHATLHLVLNANGKIIRSRLVDSSGNTKIDEAVKLALQSMKVSESLPEGMPSSMTIRISTQG